MVKTWTYKELDEKYGKLCKRYNSVCYDKQRLKAQLNKEIHYNRIMKRALEKYADEKNWDSYGNNWKFGVYKDFENDDYPEYTDEKLAQQVLKEIDNKE